jgi:AcrR family transcriptional regulator
MTTSTQESPRSTLRERQAKERRDELIDAALTTFAKRGYHATSLKEIAETAGVTDGLLIHYFGSKANLLSAVLLERQSLSAAVEEIVASAPDHDAATAIRYVALRWLAVLQGRGGPLMGILIAEARHNPEVAEALAAHTRRTLEPTERLLTRLAERGNVRIEHIPIAARMFQWSLVWYSFWRDLTPAGGIPDTEEWVAGLTAILLRGLGAGAERSAASTSVTTLPD